MTRRSRFRPTLQARTAWLDRSETRESREPQGETYQVRVVEARPGGEFCVIEILNKNGYGAAVRAAEAAQAYADERGLPRRAYICDRDGVPVAAP